MRRFIKRDRKTRGHAAHDTPLENEAHDQQMDGSAQERAKEWLASNHEAIAAYNERVRRTGVFSDGMRLF